MRSAGHDFHSFHGEAQFASATSLYLLGIEFKMLVGEGDEVGQKLLCFLVQSLPGNAWPGGSASIIMLKPIRSGQSLGTSGKLGS